MRSWEKKLHRRRPKDDLGTLPPQAKSQFCKGKGFISSPPFAGTFPLVAAYHLSKAAVRTYITTRPWIWALLLLPAAMILSPLLSNVITAVIHAVVPQVVRSLLTIV
jgi:hypothetical protein